MLYSEFSQSLFKPLTERQLELLENIRTWRKRNGLPHRLRFLRSLVRTRKFTRTVYPPGWHHIS